MLRLIINLLILVLVVRLLQPLFRRAVRILGGGAPKPRKDEPAPANDHPYDELTPYEIEDADYEEIKRPGENH